MDDRDFNEYPPRTIGGPSGNYILTADVVSAEWIEYRVLRAVMGDTGPGSALVTGDDVQLTALNTLPYNGTVTLSDNTFSRGLPFHLLATTTDNQPTPWIRVTNPQKRVCARIDTPANISLYLTIQFRDKILTKVPQPFKTVHPNDEKEYHNEREKRINKAFGREGELETYAKHTTTGGIRKVTTEPE